MNNAESLRVLWIKIAQFFHKVENFELFSSIKSRNCKNFQKETISLRMIEFLLTTYSLIHPVSYVLALKQELFQILEYTDESFTTNKNRPDDFDGCWELDDIDLEQLDPVLQDFTNGRKAQKGKYYGELFPSTTPNPSGTILDFFQQDKETGEIKGIISFDLEEFP